MCACQYACANLRRCAFYWFRLSAIALTGRLCKNSITQMYEVYHKRAHTQPHTVGTGTHHTPACKLAFCSVRIHSKHCVTSASRSRRQSDIYSRVFTSENFLVGSSHRSFSHRGRIFLEKTSNHFRQQSTIHQPSSEVSLSSSHCIGLLAVIFHGVTLCSGRCLCVCVCLYVFVV